jgi:hypothetical protein
MLLAVCCVDAMACGGQATSAPEPDAGSADASADAGTPDGAVDGGVPAADGGFVEAPHLPLPTLTFHNGTVFSHPQVVSVTWAGFPFESDVQPFGDGIVMSQWLSAVGSEYGVLGATHVGVSVLDSGTDVSITDSQLQQMLNESITAGTLPSPTNTSTSLRG